ncbi:MAG: hypothetical protein Kow0032_28940 [Methyloligellaceae bacterium]|jgi:bacterioferritin-associated ferredoxin
MNEEFSDDDILCPCSGTRRGQIRTYFLLGLDIDAISRKTGILTGCGGCEWDIAEYLKTLDPDSEI